MSTGDLKKTYLSKHGLMLVLSKIVSIHKENDRLIVNLDGGHTAWIEPNDHLAGDRIMEIFAHLIEDAPQ